MSRFPQINPISSGTNTAIRDLIGIFASPVAPRAISVKNGPSFSDRITVYENLEALYICRNVITVYPDCKSMIDVARQKLMNDPTFKHLSEDCQEYYFDFEAYASHLQEHGKFLVTEHGIFELPE